MATEGSRLRMLSVCMDLTSLHGWKSTPVGVTRVEAELARCLLQQKDITVLFARYDQTSKKFLKIEEAEVRLLLDPTGDADHPPDTVPVSMPPPKKSAHITPSTTWKGRLKQIKVLILEDFLRHQSPTMGLHVEELTQVSLHVVRTSIGLLRHLVRGLIHHGTGRSLRDYVRRQLVIRNSKLREPEESFFCDIDVYITVGFDWFGDKLDQLAARRSRFGFKIQTTCHDLIPVRAPQLVGTGIRDYYAQYFTKLIELSDHITCVSESTRQDLIWFAKQKMLDLPSTNVAHHGSPLPLKVSEPQHPILHRLQNQRFFLTVGTVEPRKNHELLLWVWRHLAQDLGPKTPKLVIIGKKGWEIERVTRRIEKNIELGHHIQWLQGVTDQDLAWAYSNCHVFLFPSFYEGWGLPVTEALAYGRPCIASNTSSIPEASAGRALLLSPKDYSAWYNTIRHYAVEEHTVTQPSPPSAPVRRWSEAVEDFLKPWRNRLGLV